MRIACILLFHVATALLAPAANVLNILTNPTPATGDQFGFAVTAAGNKLLIAAQNDDAGSGAAYLFDIDGTLLTTFANPRPADVGFSSPHFGFAVAVVGVDRALIGAYGADLGSDDSGAAYLFSLTGTLVTTFTNPTPAYGDAFGVSVTPVGLDHALIGAYGDDTGAPQAGAAYLFATNGVLLTTFTNPFPTINANFGWQLQALGNDRVVITAPGANGGSAHLFDMNGSLLTTFTNPTPALGDEFGISVAAVGKDKIVIGAHQDDTTAANAGAAYLFDTNGTLLMTFANPAPANDDGFGLSVAALGNDRLLIGAPNDDASATDSGEVYMFSTNGALLGTISHPRPAAYDHFGTAVAPLDTNLVVVGVVAGDEGASDAGSAYLLDVGVVEDCECRFRSFSRNGAVSFQTSRSNVYVGFQYSLELWNTGGWQNIPNPYWDIFMTNETMMVSFPTNLPFDRLFLRLVCSGNSLVGKAYEVYGGDSFSTDEEGWYEKGYDPGAYGYRFLGSATNTSVFSGAHNVYIIRAPPYNVAKVDSVAGSDGAYYPAPTEGNTADWLNIGGPPDGMVARVGIKHFDKGGFVVVHAFNNLTSITVHIVP